MVKKNQNLEKCKACGVLGPFLQSFIILTRINNSDEKNVYVP